MFRIRSRVASGTLEMYQQYNILVNMLEVDSSSVYLNSTIFQSNSEYNSNIETNLTGSTVSIQAEFLSSNLIPPIINLPQL